MKKLLTLFLAALMLISFVACDKANKKSPITTTDTVPATNTTEHIDTTEPLFTTPELTTPEQTTPEQTTPEQTTPEQTTPEQTTPQTTEKPYEPLYEHEGFKYQIDIRPYLQYICTNSSREYLVIANRKHPLGSSYKPKDLVYVMEGSTWQLRKTASMAFEAMRTEMIKLGVYDTYNRSTYRSYSFQSTLYYKYLEQERQKYPHLTTEELMNIVDTYSARPGTSDHQTGLTIDFNPLDESFEKLKAFKYMKDNAHKFGFILRYPKGKTYITGYTYEPWHWRFVGREVATFMYEHDLTLEEYMAILDGTDLEYFPETTPIPPVTKPPVTTEPEETEPDPTEPDSTEPDSTEPDSTEPDSTEPDSTEPDSTEPDSTEPDSTEPDSTEPDSTEPDSTEPDSTEPDSTEPDSTEPDSTEPDSTEPDSTEPDSTEPEHSSEPEISSSEEDSSTELDESSSDVE